MNLCRTDGEFDLNFWMACLSPSGKVQLAVGLERFSPVSQSKLINKSLKDILSKAGQYVPDISELLRCR